MSVKQPMRETNAFLPAPLRLDKTRVSDDEDVTTCPHRLERQRSMLEGFISQTLNVDQVPDDFSVVEQASTPASDHSDAPQSVRAQTISENEAQRHIQSVDARRDGALRRKIAGERRSSDRPVGGQPSMLLHVPALPDDLRHSVTLGRAEATEGTLNLMDGCEDRSPVASEELTEIEKLSSMGASTDMFARIAPKDGQQDQVETRPRKPVPITFSNYCAASGEECTETKLHL